MIADAIALCDFIRRLYDAHTKRHIISALFDWEGNRLEGDDRLLVTRHEEPPHNLKWWYSIEPIDDYLFIRIPVNVSAVAEILGSDGKHLSPDKFRYVSAAHVYKVLPQTLPNVKVGFMVFAYKPSDLLSLGNPQK